MVGLLGGLLHGCTSTTDTPPAGTEASPAERVALAPERLDDTWVVRLAEEASLGEYAQQAGWVSLVMKRDYAAAVRQLGPLGGLPAARAHAEASGIYRQAALLAAFSLIEVYGKTPEPSDPVGAAHLLTVSYAITGELQLANASAAKLAGVADDPTLPWHRPWQRWLAELGAVDIPEARPPYWPVDLSGLPVALPPVSVGGWPELAQVPHYALPELAGSTAARDMADPGALVALALWHEAAAAAAAGPDAALVRSYRAGYQLPVEPRVTPAGDLPMPLLFGSDLLSPGDAAFLADLHGANPVVPGSRPGIGAAAVDAHAPTSLLAELARLSRVDGRIDVERALDVAGALRQGLVARASAKTGSVLAHQRVFSDIAHTGALRGLALVAEVEGDREVSGRLRINALEQSEKERADPVGLLALAAWDASNRYPLRALDILHAQARRYPSLEIARYGLDVLGLRVASERTGETPGM